MAKAKPKAGRISSHAFDVLGDPVRRRILEILATGEQPAGTIAEQIKRQFGISQAGVSQHLSVLRQNGFAAVRVDGSRRIYSVDTRSFQVVDSWLDQFRVFWGERLHALTAEIARGKRKRREPIV